MSPTHSATINQHQSQIQQLMDSDGHQGRQRRRTPDDHMDRSYSTGSDGQTMYPQICRAGTITPTSHWLGRAAWTGRGLWTFTILLFNTQPLLFGLFLWYTRTTLVLSLKSISSSTRHAAPIPTRRRPSQLTSFTTLQSNFEKPVFHDFLQTPHKDQECLKFNYQEYMMFHTTTALSRCKSWSIQSFISTPNSISFWRT